MGIGIDVVEMLGVLRKKGHLKTPAAVMEIGAQQLSHTFLEGQSIIDETGKLFGVRKKFVMPDIKPTHTVHGKLDHLDINAPLARPFYEWLGFRYAAIDVDGSPGSIPLDLNHDAAPDSERGRYQLVTNFGTTEHVANQLNAFRVIHDLTAPGGIMFHKVPAQGMFNHGLFNYNPKFFWMLGRSNGYELLHMDFVGDDAYYNLPQNIAEMVAEFQPSIRQRKDNYRAIDCNLVFVLQKRFELPFIAPLDLEPEHTKALGLDVDSFEYMAAMRGHLDFLPSTVRNFLKKTGVIGLGGSFLRHPRVAGWLIRRKRAKTR